MPGSLDTWFVGGASLGAAERVGIYHHAYYARQIGVLAELFPRACALLGPVAFGSVARQYLDLFPSRTPVIERIGARFPAFLNRSRHREHAGLLDVARLEWARVEALLSPDGERTVSVHELATAPPLRTRLLQHPAASLLRISRVGLVLWQGAPDATEAPEAGSTYVLVSRPACDLLQRELSDEGGRALERSFAGESLARAFGEFSGADAVEKASQALASFLRLGAWAGLEVDPC